MIEQCINFRNNNQANTIIEMELIFVLDLTGISYTWKCQVLLSIHNCVWLISKHLLKYYMVLKCLLAYRLQTPAYILFVNRQPSNIFCWHSYNTLFTSSFMRTIPYFIKQLKQVVF